MSNNVINFREHIKPKQSFPMTLSVFADNSVSAHILDTEAFSPAQCREFAGWLETLSVYLRNRASDQEPDHHENLLAKVHIFQDSLVRVSELTEDSFSTAEQYEWLRVRMDDAKLAINKLEKDNSKLKSSN